MDKKTVGKAYVIKDTAGGATGDTGAKQPEEAAAKSSSSSVMYADKAQVKTIKTILEALNIFDKCRNIASVGEKYKSRSGLIDGMEEGCDGGNTADTGKQGIMFAIPIKVSKAELDSLELPLPYKFIQSLPTGAEELPQSKVSSRKKPLEELYLSLAAAGISKALLDGPEMLRKLEWVGDIAMISDHAFLSPEWFTPFADRSQLWALLASSIGAMRVARTSRIDAGLMRQSKVQLLFVHRERAKEQGWVTIPQDDIKYSFDVTRVMFSSGNVSERMRMGRMVAVGEVVVDLYCGIGYFTIPLLVHAKVAHVHACEWNPDSIEALEVNLRQNGVQDRCTVYPGDNAISAAKLQGVADRVSLGLIPSSEAGWVLGVNCLKEKGGWLHVHENVKDSNMDSWKLYLVEKLEALSRGRGLRWRVTVKHIETVKSYAPHIYHIVADCFCQNIGSL